MSLPNLAPARAVACNFCARLEVEAVAVPFCLEHSLMNLTTLLLVYGDLNKPPDLARADRPIPPAGAAGAFTLDCTRGAKTL